MRPETSREQDVREADDIQNIFFGCPGHRSERCGYFCGYGPYPALIFERKFKLLMAQAAELQKDDIIYQVGTRKYRGSD
jgi:hypothetical protein